MRLSTDCGLQGRPGNRGGCTRSGSIPRPGSYVLSCVAHARAHSTMLVREIHPLQHRIEARFTADWIESWIDLDAHDSAIADRQCVFEFVQRPFSLAKLRVNSSVLIAAVLASDQLQLGEGLHGGRTIAGACERQRLTVELLPGT